MRRRAALVRFDWSRDRLRRLRIDGRRGSGIPGREDHPRAALRREVQGRPLRRRMERRIRDARRLRDRAGSPDGSLGVREAKLERPVRSGRYACHRGAASRSRPRSSRSHAATASRAPRAAADRAPDPPNTGTQPSIVILAEFTDQASLGTTAANWSSQLLRRVRQRRRLLRRSFVRRSGLRARRRVERNRERRCRRMGEPWHGPSGFRRSVRCDHHTEPADFQGRSRGSRPVRRTTRLRLERQRHGDAG